ncbi:hypothetical protein OEZ85_009247 [Tetradesmus obliquus]|uniref:alpha-amylase n=1 Tax=Tetradesmus obliquus TaxID=3088 RepID=A0ABY8UBI3_TETOB|nr:hypothetical protein OEZ85_009247 [Tetradesmus obliquus]
MRAAIACLLVLAGLQATVLAADADAWKSQVIYFLLTDRFAQTPGTTPGGPCRLTNWNNGTWAGITSKLDYLKDMGMTAIWITPIPVQVDGEFFGETGYHGYWAKDLSSTDVDPHFGSEQDLKTLIATARKKGIMTMLDVVGNHVGHSRSNSFADITPFNKPEHYHKCIPGCDQWCSIPQHAYESRPQNQTLIEQCRLQSLPDLNQSVPFVREQLLSWLDRTLQKYDFDGLRVDTVKHVGVDFWREWTKVGKRFTLGEVLNGDASTLIKYVQGPEPAMNSLLNFPLYYALANVFVHKQGMEQLATERAAEYKLLGPEVVSTMGNFIDNHDVPRFLTQQPDDALLRNALTWILLADGMPVIYYGTGSEMTGSVQHGGNRNCLWEQGYNESNPTFQTISRLANFRLSHKLWKQPEQTLAATPDCYVYSRGPNVLVVTTNGGSGSANTCSVQLPASSMLMDNGVSAVHDLLAMSTGHDSGLVWYPTTRRLTIHMPGGSPRVLSSSPASPTSLEQSAAAQHSSSAAPATSAASAGTISGVLAALALFVAMLLL